MVKLRNHFVCCVGLISSWCCTCIYASTWPGLDSSKMPCGYIYIHMYIFITYRMCHMYFEGPNWFDRILLLNIQSVQVEVRIIVFTSNNNRHLSPLSVQGTSPSTVSVQEDRVQSNTYRVQFSGIVRPRNAIRASLSRSFVASLHQGATCVLYISRINQSHQHICVINAASYRVCV